MTRKSSRRLELKKFIFLYDTLWSPPNSMAPAGEGQLPRNSSISPKERWREKRTQQFLAQELKGPTAVVIVAISNDALMHAAPFVPS